MANVASAKSTKNASNNSLVYYSYKPISTSGINGYFHTFNPSQDLEFTEIIEIEGVHYISVTSGDVGEQSDDIEFTKYDEVPSELQEYFDQQLEQAKNVKLKELVEVSSKFDDALVCDEMIITSSLGFVANADIRSQNNIRGLLTIITTDTETVAYMDAKNEAHMLTKAQLETLISEIIANGNNLYAQKWAYRNAINNVTDIDTLNAIEFKFNMLSFN